MQDVVKSQGHAQVFGELGVGQGSSHGQFEGGESDAAVPNESCGLCVASKSHVCNKVTVQKLITLYSVEQDSLMTLSSHLGAL